MLGKNNPNFRDSPKISFVSRIRNLNKMRLWRNSILQRDGNKCVLCGKDLKNLTAHADHIYPLKKLVNDLGITDIDEAREENALWEINNGRTLCPSCHLKTRHIGYYREGDMTPTQRTIKYYKSQNIPCAVVERWIPIPTHPGGGVRRDMFGFGDIVALGENSIIAIQSCGQAFAAHDKKILEDELVAPNVLKWLECGGRVLLIGWRKIKKKRGGKLKIWSPRIKEYSVGDFVDASAVLKDTEEYLQDRMGKLWKNDIKKPLVRVKKDAMIARWDQS